MVDDRLGPSPNVHIDGIGVDPCAEFRKSEKELSNAYLRIRTMLDAFDTQPGGTDRFEVTERKLMNLIAERDDYKGRLQSIADMARIRNW